MRIKEMRELTEQELSTAIKQSRNELVELRFKHASRKLENPAKLRLCRKHLARLLTVGKEAKKRT